VITPSDFATPWPPLRATAFGLVSFCGLLALLLIGIGNMVGWLALVVLYYLLLFVVVRRRPMVILKAALMLLPVIGVGIGYHMVFAFYLMVPFVLVVYRDFLVRGARFVFDRCDAVSVGLALMISSVAVAIANAFLRDGLSYRLLMQLGLLAWVVMLTLLIINALKSGVRITTVVKTSSIPLVLFGLTILAYVAVSGFGRLFQLKHIIIMTSDVNANLPAMMMTPMLVLSLLLPRRHSADHGFARNLLFLMLLMAVVSTNSRGAWMGLMVAFIYLFDRLRKGRAITARAVVLALLAMMLIMILFGDVLLHRLGQTGLKDHSFLSRLLLWKYALSYLAENPFIGLGPDIYRTAKIAMGYPSIYDPELAFSSHNLFLEIAVNYGGLCLIGCILALGGVIRRLDARARSATDPRMRYALLTLNAALLSMLAHGLFDTGIANVGVAAVMAVVAGLALAAFRATDAELAMLFPGGLDGTAACREATA